MYMLYCVSSICTLIYIPSFRFMKYNVIIKERSCVGGKKSQHALKYIRSECGEWKEVLHPMPTKRLRPTTASTPTHLVVAGGSSFEYDDLATCTVEVLDTVTLQWSTASSLPEAVSIPQMILCGECFYVSDDDSIFCCSVEEFLKSLKSNGVSVLSRLTSIPVHFSSLATLRGHVL